MFNVDDIIQGKFLDQALETTVEDFFQKRIHNKIKKVNVGNWEIFYQNTAFIYFGYPVLKGLFSSKRVCSVFYKVQKDSLIKIFPGYETITGISIRPQLYPAILAYEKKTNPKIVDMTLMKEYRGELKKDFIELILEYRLNHPERSYISQFQVLIHKKEGQILSIEKIKDF